MERAALIRAVHAGGARLGASFETEFPAICEPDAIMVHSFGNLVLILARRTNASTVSINGGTPRRTTRIGIDLHYLLVAVDTSQTQLLEISTVDGRSFPHTLAATPTQGETA